ncbi:MBL fold metallo-hydrolase [Anaerococcus hydrogenalis]|uniref:MBL fold metallo-hydrolase n=1 Tax=Anaerococcus hydrogenalis TaxID=33029 RepID=UPI001D7AD938|nr:MBL fold metallo-hydrolase [Anaerococcus hydrogenalis]MBS5988635.1 MBL fold metallo-hydrolase [Anaerococcus hydrogenalis]
MIEKIIITYIYHSCYSVEIGDYFIIFDYYKGVLNIPENKKVIFVSSHGHSDHYTSEILKIPNMKNYTYILSTDIAQLENDDNIIYIKNNKLGIDQLKSLYNSKNVYLIDPDQEKEIKFKNDKIRIKSFGSTDEGISILLDICGITIFHAGDLNYWAWDDYDDKTLKKEYYAFIEQVDKIKKYSIDIAFFPVDYRLRDNYYKGPKIFADNVRPQLMFPLHSGDHEKISQKFNKEIVLKETIFRPIIASGQKIIVDIKD